MNELMRELLFLPDQASTVALEIDELHYFVISVTMVGSLLVFAAAAYFLARFRTARGASLSKKPASVMALEGGLTVFVTTLFLIWWVIGFAQYLRIESPPPNCADVYVTAKQWMWKFTYPS